MTETAAPAAPAARRPSKRARTGRACETPDFGGFVRRAIRALGRRVAAGDVEAITELVRLSAEVDEALAAAVAGLRAEGYSWAEIGTRLGVSRQAVHKRFGQGA